MTKNILFSVLIAIFSLATTLFSYAQEPMRLPPDANPLVIESNGKDYEFQLEIADTDESRMRGLMYRTDFPANGAMLFVFDQRRLITMWMRNTPLPLDMLFLDEQGIIQTIHQNAVPFSEAIISSGVAVSYVVELHAGDVARFGIKAGDKVKHERICGACK